MIEKRRSLVGHSLQMRNNYAVGHFGSLLVFTNIAFLKWLIKVSYCIFWVLVRALQWHSYARNCTTEASCFGCFFISLNEIGPKPSLFWMFEVLILTSLFILDFQALLFLLKTRKIDFLPFKIAHSLISVGVNSLDIFSAWEG